MINLFVPSSHASIRLDAGRTVSLEDPFGPYNRPREVTVAGAIYGDNSWEGDPRFVKVTFTLRRVQAFAIEKFELPILASAAADHGNLSQVVKQLREVAGRMDASRDLDEMNASQYPKRTADSLEHPRGQDALLDAKARLGAVLQRQKELLQVLQTHIDPALSHFDPSVR
ncbi:MAG TPA: hypothetical protein VG675_20885 [Bryobacteraceae bacterium]|nr:hypothetical protein [Bryobacteraceae bacterium]